jgi:ornithine cyclodeaminase
MRSVRTLGRVRVWSPSRERLGRFVSWARATYGIEAEAATDARTAVEGADVVCTVSASPTPVLEGAWLAPGAHINAVGASLPSARELDTSAVARSRLFVDRRESALSEAGDFLIARSDGAVGDDHLVGEIGEVFAGQVAGREDDQQITLFKSLGLAVEDLAAASYVLHAAEAGAIGAVVDFDGAA